MKIIPRSGGSTSRYIRPCCRVSSSATTSTCTVDPSGKTMRGPAGAGWVGAVGGGEEFTPHDSRRSIATATSSFLILHLDDILLPRFARDELVFLRVVSKGPERHPKQLGGLR